MGHYSIISLTTQFLVRSGQIQRSAKGTAMGCTWAYCPLQESFVSGSRCATYHKKLIKVCRDNAYTSYPIHMDMGRCDLPTYQP
jgi:hypothetical protein